jgi:cytochrome bd ubiquinol oxidase subunit I
MPEFATQLTVLAEEPAGLLAAREQMALSLGWHIVLACFGVAFPAMIFVMHRRGIRRNDTLALELAKRWSKCSAVLFAIGAVSGTVLSFEMGLLWPGLMGTYGDVLGLPFAFEGISFFIEAIFLGIYLYGWGRMEPRRHLLMLLPMACAGASGTFMVVAVNAWMNKPSGFVQANPPFGEVTEVNPWAVITDIQAFGQFAHMWVAGYIVVGFSVAGVYAVGMLRGRRDEHHRLGFMVPFAFATVAALTQPFVGHLLGVGLDERQPAKLAAFELAEEEESPSPLRLGGIYVDGEVKGSIDIPVLGSLAAQNSFTKPVPGWDEIPEADRPPANITHWSFQIMIGIGSAFATVVAWFWLARWRRRDLLQSRLFLRFMAGSGPLAVVCLEAGWIATEVGRQPWIVYGYMRTEEAAGSYSGLWWLFGVTVVVYTGMTVFATVVLRSMARRWRAGATIASPYGPSEQPAEAAEAS